MPFSHSAKTMLLWKVQIGKVMASYSATRWLSKWEIYHQLLVQVGDILPFLERNADLGAASRRKLLAVLQDAQRSAFLKIELAAVVDYGEPFVELPVYLAKVDGVDSGTDCEKWWKEYESTLPNWAAAAKKVLVAQPYSAAADRVFSLLNSSFGSQQDSSLKDYIGSSLMLRYNNR